MALTDLLDIEFHRGLKFSLTEQGSPDLELKTKQLEALTEVVRKKESCFSHPANSICQVFNILTSAEYVNFLF